MAHLVQDYKNPNVNGVSPQTLLFRFTGPAREGEAQELKHRMARQMRAAEVSIPHAA